MINGTGRPSLFVRSAHPPPVADAPDVAADHVQLGLRDQEWVVVAPLGSDLIRGQ